MNKHKYQKYKGKYLNLKKEIKIKRSFNLDVDLKGGSESDKNDDTKFEYLGTIQIVPIYKIEFISVNEIDLYKDSTKPNRDKILYINDIEQFDNFTDKYGGIENDFIYIKWEEVSKDFKGFGLDTDSGNDLYKRFRTAIYKGNEYNSWWEFEYDVDLEDVIIFDRKSNYLGYY